MGSYGSRGREQGPARKRAVAEEQKEAAGSCRSKGREEGPAQKSTAAEDKNEATESCKVADAEKVLLGRELRGEVSRIGLFSKVANLS